MMNITFVPMHFKDNKMQEMSKEEINALSSQQHGKLLPIFATWKKAGSPWPTFRRSRR